MVKDQNCMAFCQLTNNKVYCDQNVLNYCTQTADDDTTCACINSEFPGQLGAICFDPKCQNQGYQTLNMINRTCPKCSQYVNAEGDNFYQKVNQKMVCEDGQVKIQPPEPTEIPAQVPAEIPAQVPAELPKLPKPDVVEEKPVTDTKPTESPGLLTDEPTDIPVGEEKPNLVLPIAGGVVLLIILAIIAYFLLQR